MFTDDERNEMVMRTLLVLEQEKVGRADARRALAEKLVDDSREFLKGIYKDQSTKEKNTSGMWQTRDIVKKEDFGS